MHPHLRLSCLAPGHWKWPLELDYFALYALMKFLLSSKEEFYACKEFSWLLHCVTGELCSLSPYFSHRYVGSGCGGLSAHRLPSAASCVAWDPELPPGAGELAPWGAGQTDQPLGPPWRGEVPQQGTAAQSYPCTPGGTQDGQNAWWRCSQRVCAGHSKCMWTELHKKTRTFALL